MAEIEFSRPVKSRHLPGNPVELAADSRECELLARRFGLVSVEALTARLDLEPDDDAVIATGVVHARIVQTCAVSGDDFATDIEEDTHLRFVPATSQPGEAGAEIEIGSEDFDEIEFTGDAFDLGEAVAQSLGLAIDPYATGPEAARIRQEAGLLEEGAAGPLAEALAALGKE